MESKKKQVRLEDEVHEELRKLAFTNRTSIKEEANSILKRELKLEGEVSNDEPKKD
jgi:plasmid stability protein